jgi:hypothetical protein
MARAKRTARKAKRTAKKTARKAVRTTKRTNRQAIKTNRSNAKLKRKTTRQITRQSRLDAKAKRQGARQAKRLVKYAPELEPEIIEETEALLPFMEEQLYEQGIELENPDDDSEILLRYTQMNDDIEDPMDDDDFNDAFINDEENFDSHFDYQKAKKTAKQIAMGALGGAATSLNNYGNELAKKPKDELTANERKLLSARASARRQIKEVAKDDILDTLKPILIILAIALVAYVAIKKLA